MVALKPLFHEPFLSLLPLLQSNIYILLSDTLTQQLTPPHLMEMTFLILKSINAM